MLGGNIAPSVTTVLDTSKVFSDPATTLASMTPVITATMTANNAQNIFMANGTIGVSGDFLHSGILSGYRSALSLTASADATDYRSFWSAAGAAAPNTLVNRYGFYYGETTGTFTLTNQYAIYVEALAKGSTINRVLYSAGGLSVHVGAFRFGSTTAPTNIADGDVTAIRVIAKGLYDDDLDTSVLVESSADEDIIRFATGATARGRFSSAGLLLVNASDLDFYSDDGVTRKASIDGTLGHALFGGTTAVPTNTILTATETFVDSAALTIAFSTTLANSMTANNSTVFKGINAITRPIGAFTASGIHTGVWTQFLTTAGSTVLSDYRGLENQCNVGSGTTLTTRHGLYIGEAVGSGTLTTQYGAYFEALTKGTTDWVIYSLGGQSSHLGSFRFGDNTAPAAIVDVIATTLGNALFRIQSTATNDDPIDTYYQNRVATTDATVTTLHTHTIPATTTVMLIAYVVARRTGGTAGTAEDGAGYMIQATVKNVAGTATIIGAVNQICVQEDVAAYNATIDVTAATARVRVTGVADTNITWHLSKLQVMSVGS